jgi:hypothetical protein
MGSAVKRLVGAAAPIIGGAIGGPVGAAIGGAVSTAISGREQARQQQAAINAQTGAANEARALGQERFDRTMGMLERDVMPGLRQNVVTQGQIADEALATSRAQRGFADRQLQEYETTALPNERRVFSDAANYDSADNVARRGGMAAANVNQQFSNSTAQRARLLTRFGLNPNSSAFARQAGADARAQAAASAGAQTGAMFDTMDRAIALRRDAANLGRNMVNTSLQANEAAGNSARLASGASGAAASGMLPAIDVVNSAYGARTGIGLDAGRIAGGALQTGADAWGKVTQGLGDMTGQIVNNAGGWGKVGEAIGGAVRRGWGMISPANPAAPLPSATGAFGVGPTGF